MRKYRVMVTETVRTIVNIDAPTQEEAVEHAKRYGAVAGASVEEFRTLDQHVRVDAEYVQGDKSLACIDCGDPCEVTGDVERVWCSKCFEKKPQKA